MQGLGIQGLGFRGVSLKLFRFLVMGKDVACYRVRGLGCRL